MSTAVSVESRITRVDVTDETITAHLVDGRVISVPLAWSWRLSDATPSQRANWELIGDGHGVHWPAIDEDISAEGMLSGIPAQDVEVVDATRFCGGTYRSHRHDLPCRSRPGSFPARLGRHIPAAARLSTAGALRERASCSIM